MKLSPNFLIHVQEEDGEYLLIPVADAKFSGVVRGNKTLGTILELLKEGSARSQSKPFKRPGSSGSLVFLQFVQQTEPVAFLFEIFKHCIEFIHIGL